MSPALSRLAYCVLAAAALTTTSAQAQSINLSSEISDFTYRLIDLDLNDNISPSILFTGTADKSYSQYSDRDSQVVSSQTINTLGNTAASHAGGAASTSTTATSWRSTASANATAATDGTMTSTTEHYMNFTLSPNTGLILSGRGTIVSEASNMADSAYAYAAISLSGTIASKPGSDSVENMNFQQSFFTQVTGVHKYTMSGYLASGYSESNGSFRIFTNNYARVLSPVPEPETYAMLLAGLALVGVCARRKRASQAVAV